MYVRRVMLVYEPASDYRCGLVNSFPSLVRVQVTVSITPSAICSLKSLLTVVILKIRLSNAFLFLYSLPTCKE